ncbi:ABC transporter permease (plasmid) [Agrobacterium leguminum]|uniref:Autoinducer 2 import system permease protein LsrC n=1 Tax=Agrobacterium deltaense NCPPB 1641 TaxID=1183425 RepID=A0A1S7UAS6_9HYPH|nr:MULTISPECIES: ABC transporter permease [Agrobacterium]WFS69727.1 ABC transporter permease [Agrobacterium leguminum]CVI64030.1 Monosaccharide ABC transporter membrane protein, CUT2 family [Agrobacterium deltaense NCPPB 1641]
MNLYLRVPWIWSLLGIALLWAIMAATRGNFGPQLITAALMPASFLVLVAVGQSFAMMTGAGNVDLSISSTITLSAFITINLIGGSDGMVAVGILVGVLIGACVGISNAMLILWLKIPAIIATLASGYVVYSLSLLQNHGLATNLVAPSLLALTKGWTAFLPNIVIFAMVIAGFAAFIYQRTGYGRMLLATGQNRLAAMRASIPTTFIIAGAFMVSGVLAGVTGVLLAANAGGAFLDMGSSYLLLSVGAVVVGGTPIFGGRVTIVGTVLGALFLTILGTAIRLIGVPGGGQEILQGAIIIGVLLMAGISERRAHA